jgi:hypothetical protein
VLTDGDDVFHRTSAAARDELNELLGGAAVGQRGRDFTARGFEHRSEPTPINLDGLVHAAAPVSRSPRYSRVER